MIRGVLLDIGGVVAIGRDLLPGALDALDSLRVAGLPIRLITNTTRQSRQALQAQLDNWGLGTDPAVLFTPATAARAYLLAHGLHPHLLVHPRLEPEFAGLPAGGPVAVVVGDAGDAFTYGALNGAFRRLLEGADFLALARNRMFTEPDGPSLDAGPFVAALEYACGRTARLFGKPAPAFFLEALHSLRLPPAEVAMIGDDAESDIAGAMALGCRGILVRTGKYRPGDEARIAPAPDAVVADLTEAVAWLLAR
ncbi:MAG TPA: TIGR01458 family HAD-type hydrolase [Azospirillum sp.]|nr:TIGR01458 family HAD-type hydrolase [Azospirillum sp.]